MSSEYIPVEIQEEILKRLPAVKALLRFRSVSKPWKNLIDNRDFIVSYGVRHPPRSSHRIILRTFRCEYYPWHSKEPREHKCVTFVDNDDDGSFVRQDFIPTVPDLNEKYVDFIGISHGLLCFKGYAYNGREVVVLWNFSIRKFVGIQVPYMHTSPLKFVDNFGIVDVIGFGVCLVTCDSTILKIKCKTRRFPLKVAIFTLSTRTWSILSTNLTHESIRLRGSHIVIDRFIYWLAFEILDAEDGRGGLHYLIMSFDLTAKEFKELNILPGSLSKRFCSSKSISKLRESLFMFEGNVSDCSLWMMTKEQGVNRLFTKLYNINVPHSRIKTLLGFRKTGELILATEGNDKHNVELEIYDPNSNAIDNLGTDGCPGSFSMCSYMESLLLLDQLNGYIYIPSLTNHKMWVDLTK